MDIYGLSEVIGPGVSVECLEAKKGLHIFEDHFIPEIINPETGQTLSQRHQGELVFTSITKEAFPIIRYRTRDVTSLDREPCICGRTLRACKKLAAEPTTCSSSAESMFFPRRSRACLWKSKEVEPHYQLVVDRMDNLDTLTVMVEVGESFFSDEVRVLQGIEKKLSKNIKGVPRSLGQG